MPSTRLEPLLIAVKYVVKDGSKLGFFMRNLLSCEKNPLTIFGRTCKYPTISNASLEAHVFYWEGNQVSISFYG